METRDSVRKACGLQSAPGQVQNCTPCRYGNALQKSKPVLERDSGNPDITNPNEMIQTTNIVLLFLQSGKFQLPIPADDQDVASHLQI